MAEPPLQEKEGLAYHGEKESLIQVLQGCFRNSAGEAQNKKDLQAETCKSLFCMVRSGGIEPPTR